MCTEPAWPEMMTSLRTPCLTSESMMSVTIARSVSDLSAIVPGMLRVELC